MTEIPFPGFTSAQQGWICPKCGKVWGPMFYGPCPCYQTIIAPRLDGTGSPPPDVAPFTGTPIPFPGFTCGPREEVVGNS